VFYLKVSCQCAVAMVFLVSAGSKLRSRPAFRSFRESLSATRILPAPTVRAVAAALTGIESAVVVLVLVPATTIAGFLLSFALLAVLSIGIVRTRRQNSAVPCRCFGASKTPLGMRHVVRNVGLMFLAGSGGAGALARPEAAGQATVLAVGVGAVLAVLAITFDDLAELFLPAPVPK
jgi:hypothetical protein